MADVIQFWEMQMSTHRTDTSMNYEMGGTILSTTVKENDLGVTMNAKSQNNAELQRLRLTRLVE